LIQFTPTAAFRAFKFPKVNAFLRHFTNNFPVVVK
jgi:hypothetical protein